MSLYHAVNGVNNAVWFILPMLNIHPDNIGRFRDCWAGKATNDDKEVDQFKTPIKTIKGNVNERIITIYTRTGGGNRECYIEENKDITKINGFINDEDDNFDCTYAYWYFKVPNEFTKDFDIYVNTGDITKFSEEYKKRILSIYPNLKEKLKEDKS
jgi:hypothetical protein